MGGPGFISKSPASCIQIVRKILRDLVICIRLLGGEEVIALPELLDFDLETVSQMGYLYNRLRYRWNV